MAECFFYKGYLSVGMFGFEQCWKDKNSHTVEWYETRLTQADIIMNKADLWKSNKLWLAGQMNLAFHNCLNESVNGDIAFSHYMDFNHYLENPLTCGEYNSIDVALAKFPYLQTLILDDNTDISDENLSQANNLKELSLKNNEKVSNSSVSKLTNLTILNLNCAQWVTGDALVPLTKLTTLSLGSEYRDILSTKDYSKCLELPDLKHLNYQKIGDLQQEKMYIIEGLFSLIEKDEKKRNNPEYTSLKKWYENRVLVPNNYSLGFGVEDITHFQIMVPAIFLLEKRALFSC